MQALQSIAIPNKPALYESGGRWVACDESGDLQIVPQANNGWELRRPYLGHRSLLALHPVAGGGKVLALCLGIPFASQL